MECLAHSKDAIGQLYRAEAICLWAAPRPHPLSSVKRAYYAIYFIRLKPSHKEGNSDFQVQPLFKFSQDHRLLPFIELLNSGLWFLSGACWEGIAWSQAPFSPVGSRSRWQVQLRGGERGTGSALAWALLLAQGDASVAPAVGWKMPRCWELAGKSPNCDPGDFQGLL